MMCPSFARRARRARGGMLVVLACAGAFVGVAGVAQETADSGRGVADVSLNTIEDRTTALHGLYARLSGIQQTGREQAVVLHIGDSHIQAGFFGDAARAEFRRSFGDAGHGIVVPRYRRRVVSLGRVRYVVTLLDKPQRVDAIEFRIALKDDDPSPGFTRLVFIHEKGPQNLDFVVLGDDLRPVATVTAMTTEPQTGTTSVMLPAPSRGVTVRTRRTNPRQRYAQVHAVSLENDVSGVRYSSFGIVGATAETFVQSLTFRRVLEAVQPDLVVVSLGTNDATAHPFREDVFGATLNSLIALIRQISPRSGVLLTTPPDSFSRPTRRAALAPNPNVPAVRRVTLDLAGAQQYATWDLFTIMGGPGSIKTWRSRTLANADLVHFTINGYQLQGTLFAQALVNGFSRYVASRPR